MSTSGGYTTVEPNITMRSGTSQMERTCSWMVVDGVFFALVFGLPGHRPTVS